CAAPQRASPRAAASTSVSKPIGTSNAARTLPTKSKFCQPILGVEVMWPKVGEDGHKSTGPNEPIPIACNFPSLRSRKKFRALAIVASGEVVGNCVMSRLAGSLPTAHTNLVPPASMAPNKIFVPLCQPAFWLRSQALDERLNE